MTHLPTLVIIFMLSTLAVLIIGIVLMAIGNKINDKYSNKLMTLRIVLQTISLVALALYFLTHH